MNHYHILANSPEEQVNQLATRILQLVPQSQVKVLSGPRQGLVMLRVRETVANSLFNAGEVLVTEVKLELDGQFGFGMCLGDHPQRALATALVDAAMRSGGPLVAELTEELVALEQAIVERQRREQALVAATKVEFERM